MLMLRVVISNINESSDEESEVEEASDSEEEEQVKPKRKKLIKKKMKEKASFSQTRQTVRGATAGRPSAQKRIQELQVRNEEQQHFASKEDQKRTELIAAKFDSDRRHSSADNSSVECRALQATASLP